MGILGTSNGTVLGAVQAQGDQQFKNVNNLLSLQDNHVEEFLLYHGEAFCTSYEKLLEDVEKFYSKATPQIIDQILLGVYKCMAWTKEDQANIADQFREE